MLRLALSPAALRKLDSTFDYIANKLKSPQAAASTVVDILDQLDSLKSKPDIGPPLTSRIGSVPDRFKETRFLVCGRPIAVYDRDEKTIQVLAIYHEKEDFIGRVLGELQLQ
jgi:plasmid stabilization system protein ParE